MGERGGRDGREQMNWVPPCEVFFWTNEDDLGNTQVEVRDAMKRTMFFMRIRGHEYHASKELKEVMAPMIVSLLNSRHSDMPFIYRKLEPLQPVQDAIPANGNGHLSEVVPKRRGAPKGGWPSQIAKRLKRGT